MSGAIKPPSSSDGFWNQPSVKMAGSPPFGKKEGTNDTLFSIDEAPDFHNPYSDLSLFLSQKIKQEMHAHGSIKKWSHKIQEDLIQKITPDFQQKFPHYRLGISALKKMWDKISYYLAHIQDQKEAITQEGKLNIPFFIKENLKNFSTRKISQPHHFAHQLAVKMSECIATIDGIKPKLDHLTRMIWALQRHLLTGSPDQLKSPYDEYDKMDRLIVKLILEITAKEPQIEQKQLEHKVKESLQSLHELPSFASIDMMTFTIAALFAEKTYPLTEPKHAAIAFIKKQIDLCKKAYPTLKYSDLVRRIIALYTLASGLPKDLSDEAILSQQGLPQPVYAFIAAENTLGNPNTLVEIYHETKLLPILQGDVLEMIIWKALSDYENLLEKLPYKIGQKIEEEIANTLIDNPKQSFSLIVQITVQFFQRLKELGIQKQMQEMERKIHLWTIQGDLLCRWIKLDHEAPLLKLIEQKFQTTPDANHYEFVSQICMEYLKQHPELAPYLPQVNVRIWILYKYIWYIQTTESSLCRFLKWHQQQNGHNLQELCNRIIPHLPVDIAKLQTGL